MIILFCLAYAFGGLMTIAWVGPLVGANDPNDDGGGVILSLMAAAIWPLILFYQTAAWCVRKISEGGK